MHIPDGFLDLPVAALCAVLAAGALAVAARRADGDLGGERAPLVGVVAAGIFAAQMLNWPIPGGTSAHFVGGTLAAVLLGPHLGALAVAAVVVVQSLLFGDGGVVVLGANVLNMAVVQVYVGYVLYRGLAARGEFPAAFVAGWLGITAAALAGALQLGVSSAFAYETGTVVAVVAGGHLLLGLIEGAVTAVVVRALGNARPDLRRSAAPEVEA